MIILLILFILAFILLSFRRIDIAAVILIAALPSYLIRFKLLGVPFTLLEVMILLLALVWVVKYTEFCSQISDIFKGRFKSAIEKYKSNRKARLPYPFRWEITLLLVVSFGAVAVAGFTDSAFGIWKAYFFEPLLFFVVILNLFRLPGERERLTIDKVVLSLAVSAFFVSALAIYQKLTGNLISNPLWAAEETRRVVSFFGYPNAVGLYLAPIAMILFGRISEKKSWFLNTDEIPNNKSQITKFGNFWNLEFGIWCFMVVTILLSLLSIWFARSEGAIVGISVGFVFFFLFWIFRSRVRIVSAVLAILLGVIVLSPFIYLKLVPPYKYFDSGNKAVDYVLTKITLKDVSGEIRKQQWRETWQMLADSPTRFLFGAGLSGYQAAVSPIHQPGIFYNFENDPDFRRKIVWFNEEYKAKHWQPVEIYMYPHNLVLNFWTEIGFIGVILFIIFISKYLYFGIWNLRFGILKGEKTSYFNIGLVCAMIVIVVHSLVDVPYFKNDLAVMFWLMLAMISYIKMNNE